jgi:4-amino-4-deoxy-L-arabinose transferase-like glycosyltransferase
MPGSADFIQHMVHAIEAGGLAVWIRRGLAVLAIIAMGGTYFWHFRGLATSQAMDQAQIGREIARGHGWQTNFVRPRSVAQLQAHGKDVVRKVWSDTYNAPLPPLVDAIALLQIRSSWKMTPSDLIYSGDKAIAAVSIFLFVASVVVLFFTVRRLFDQRLAILGCGLVLICDMLWQYSLSGLPQMLLLFLFNATLYALVRAVENKYAGDRFTLWLAVVGVGFGLLALTNALTIWIFAAALIFCIFFFPPRRRTAAVLMGIFMIIYLPWLLRNFLVCGNPGGIAIYSVFDGMGHSEAGWMRRADLDLEGVGLGAFRAKIIGNLFSQTGHILEYLGWSIVALMFFAALLHGFKRREAGIVRWMILAMWAGAVLGMCVYGVNEEQGFAANQLHLIFMPLMTCYGLAYLLVQWNRRGIDIPLARTGFIALLFLLCGFPMINSLVLAPKKSLIRWPPYIPFYIAVLNDWMKPEEIIASDMPWATAWYADRHSLWVPDTVKTFTEFSDYRVLGGPVNGLYFTPISGSQNNLRDILKGEYRDWGQVILRTFVLEKMPLKWAFLLGFENECIFFSDYDRQHIRSQ